LNLLQGDWHQGIEERFDIVVSNPPYIPSAVIDTLEIEVAQHDPRLALDGGHDGLDAYRTLLEALPHLLKPDGLFAFEFGIGQSDALLAMAQAVSGLTHLRIIKDLSNLDRVLLGSFVPSGD
jgi:release factor glutamine methyltransferase